MNAVERVQQLCKDRKIPISKVESDLKFGNAYIKRLKKGTFPDDRLRMLADYFGVSTDYLMYGKERESNDYQEQAELFLKIRHDEKMLSALEKFYQLSDKQKEHIFELIDLFGEEIQK